MLESLVTENSLERSPGWLDRSLSLSFTCSDFSGWMSGRQRQVINLMAGGCIFGSEFLKAEGNDLSLDRRLGPGPSGHWENWGH